MAKTLLWSTTMQRDARLRGLSRDHHHALTLARRVDEASRRGALDQSLAYDVIERFDTELAAHFAVEEDVLMPALLAVGCEALARRLLREHDQLRALIARARPGAPAELRDFGALLRDHVRFEERELFPACEANIPADVLLQIARHHGARCG